MSGQPIETPCINVCTMDPVTGCCLGCGRTIEEIAAWGMMRAKARARVMRELDARMTRMRALGRPVARKP